MRKHYLLLTSIIVTLCVGAVRAQEEQVVKASTLSDIPENKLYNEGIALAEQKNYAAAIEKFTAAIAIKADFAEAYYNRAIAKNLNDDAESALEDLERAITLQATANMYFLKGRISQNLDYHEEAMEAFTQALTLNSALSDAYYYRAALHFAAGQYDDAIGDYTECIRVSPKYADAYNDRASCYRQMGQYDLAIEDYTQAININKTTHFLYTNRGSVYRMDKRYEEAIKDYDVALSLTTENKALILNNKGLTHDGMGDFESAVKDFLAAQQADATYLYAYNNAGNAYYKLKKYAEAKEQYNKAIEINPNFGEAYLNRGIVLEMLREDACADWSKAAELEIKIANSYIAKQCN
ncbi:hypothetical protein FACS189452_05680 [Bacteroidia bacterium]|nr:hypothetical protein FACS189452_05680 [Bacteroidia bacterium]GHT81822.1 hypothetical protein FACS189467_6460 [Bacteroidia bacterium]